MPYINPSKLAKLKLDLVKAKQQLKNEKVLKDRHVMATINARQALRKCKVERDKLIKRLVKADPKFIAPKIGKKLPKDLTGKISEFI